MIVVIILWKVLPGDENRRAFFEHWAQALELGDRSGLVGEYLSRPLSQNEVEFDCSLLGVSAGDEYVPYFNVGIWDSLDAFRQQIIERIVEQGPEKHDFEYEPRKRMILAPQLWRVAGAQPPTEDQLQPE